MERDDFKKLEQIRSYYDKTDISELIEKGEDINVFNKEDYLEWKKKRKTKLISIRLPEDLLERMKREAKKLGIGYQTLIRMELTRRFGGEPEEHVSS